MHFAMFCVDDQWTGRVPFSTFWFQERPILQRQKTVPHFYALRTLSGEILSPFMEESLQLTSKKIFFVNFQKLFFCQKKLLKTCMFKRNLKSGPQTRFKGANQLPIFILGPGQRLWIQHQSRQTGLNISNFYTSTSNSTLPSCASARMEC